MTQDNKTMSVISSGTNVVLIVYGQGGHNAQMQRFWANAPEELKAHQAVVLTNVKDGKVPFLRRYFCPEARSKYSLLNNLFLVPLYCLVSAFQTSRILIRYRVTGMISTGPGIAVVPGLICRLLGIKVIYLESWSRVYTPSLAGRVMYRLADIFFVQHESIKKYYPKAKFMGRL